MQESALKAFKAFPGYSGGNARAWLLTIVRHTCLTAIEQRRSEGKVIVMAETTTAQERLRETFADTAPLPDATVISQEDQRRIHTAVAALPRPFREVLVMHEFHDMSYREISDVVGAPVGTVMSRLARAREKLAVVLMESGTKPGAKSKS